MGTSEERSQARLKRKKRIRKKIYGSKDQPRLCVFRSTRHIYAQIIDDVSGNTLLAVSSNEKAVKAHPKFENKIQMAEFVGKLVGERALKMGMKKVVFDRNGFLYHGRVKAVSAGAREAGLEF